MVGFESLKLLRYLLKNYIFEVPVINGLDVGYGNKETDPFPGCIGWDKHSPRFDSNDPELLPFPAAHFDTVYSSHALEHMLAPRRALGEWYRVLKPGGLLIIQVPHRDLYEKQMVLPSRFNPDHKRFYTPALLLDYCDFVFPRNEYRLRHLSDLDDGYDYTLPQEKHPVGCYSILLVIEKL